MDSPKIQITPDPVFAMIEDQFVWNVYYYRTMLPNAKLTLDRNGMPVPEALRDKKISWFQ